MPRLKTILYCPEKELPAWWDEAISSKAMLRLKDVGMNCGLEYTRFPFADVLSLFAHVGNHICCHTSGKP